MNTILEAPRPRRQDPSVTRFSPRRGASASRLQEKLIQLLLFGAAASSIAITLGIVGILVYESVSFFRHVSMLDFLTDRQWTPLFDDAHYGILSLLSGTIVT